MNQNLMAQELSDNELEQVVGGHHCQPKRHNWCDHRPERQHCEPKPCYPHEWHHCEPVVHCHVDWDFCGR